MLVLSRLRDETIMIGDDIEITIVDIRGDKVRLGINAPTRISVHRKEVYEAIRQENTHAARAGSPGTGGAEFDLPHLCLPLSAGPPRTKGLGHASAPPHHSSSHHAAAPPSAQTPRPRSRGWGSLAVPVQPVSPRTRRRDGPHLPPPSLAPAPPASSAAPHVAPPEVRLAAAESSTA